MTPTIVVDRNDPDPVAVNKAADVVRRGGVIVYPTETLYGVGANALDPAAVRKVRTAKGRDGGKPILVVVDSLYMMEPLVKEVTTHARQLMDTFWPGPLTLVLKTAANIPHELTQGTESVGIRIPSSIFCLRLLAELKMPLTSTSANISGEPPTRSLEASYKLHGIDLFIDAGVLPESLPSTVIDVTSTVPKVIREGAVLLAEIQRALPGLPLTN